jgi:hypothetical protein
MKLFLFIKIKQHDKKRVQTNKRQTQFILQFEQHQIKK